MMGMCTYPHVRCTLWVKQPVTTCQQLVTRCWPIYITTFAATWNTAFYVLGTVLLVHSDLDHASCPARHHHGTLRPPKATATA